MTCGEKPQLKKIIYFSSVPFWHDSLKNTRWFISHCDFRMGCGSLFTSTGWLKNTRWSISHHDFRMGHDALSTYCILNLTVLPQTKTLTTTTRVSVDLLACWPNYLHISILYYANCPAMIFLIDF